MVRLTADLIGDSQQFINAVSDRQLNLRDCKIPAIENLGATRNQFDTIDFTNNDLKKFDNLPVLPRLKSVLLSNNRISHIQPDIGKLLPNLSTLVLNNNNMQELGDLEPLAQLPKLEYLSLMGNPVTKKPQYRLYTIFSIPSVRVLDFKRIRMHERETARKAFKGSRGRELAAKIVKKTKTFVAGSLANDDDEATAAAAAGPSAPHLAQDVQRIKEAIAAAKSLQEVENLQQMLASGQIPGSAAPPADTNGHGGMEEEEEEEEENEEEGEEERIEQENTEEEQQAQETTEQPPVGKEGLPPPEQDETTDNGGMEQEEEEDEGPEGEEQQPMQT